MRTTTLNIAIWLCGTLLCVAGVSHGAETSPKLTAHLKGNPQADLNKDGVLTEAEWKTFRKQKRDAARSAPAPTGEPDLPLTDFEEGHISRLKPGG